MKPVKALLPLSIWLLRIATLLLIFQMHWFDLKDLQFSHPGFILALIFVVIALMVIAGGLFAKPWMTIIAGIFLFGLSVYEIFLIQHEGLRLSGMAYLVLASLGLFFVANGNN